ncbi:putative autoinducer synthetase (modular protein) [Bradyrhizobium sp. ORS 285]|uniref:acyl-homoserine-lactone synthase n=1 Tax=Bradyrhizobium sp. ORS 285 TaxID=115808 RepID=UPI000240A549|nr:acyl-homoserine-lactone synthase [Bradyrhizobium sp. ORS 285]CCD84690.1 putative autoinducer synthetase (modular protein) [Bradyrhizobium sp. ORS 285]SMX61207.1 putative autoinducer synthetase (modular protein) [Bradyrhizobium sp. ORS 285]
MRTVSIRWDTVHRHGEAWISHHRLRYRMFVERQRWSVPHYQGIEYDQFDTPAATYILVVDDHDQALGTARLIPTTRPYMVRSLWPDLVDGSLPHSDAIWEASRFGCDRALSAGKRREVIGQLIQGCQEFGLANGISCYLGVMPSWIFKNVIAAHGCPVRPLGTKLRLEGHDIGAAYIGVSAAILESVRRHTGIPSALNASPSPAGPVSPALSPRLAEDALLAPAEELAYSPDLEGLAGVR